MDNKYSVLPVIIATVIVVVLSLGIFVFFNSKGSTLPEDESDIISEDIQGENMDNIQDFEKLNILTIRAGQGKEALVGTTVSVHYEGKLVDGTKFDSSYDRGVPFEFTLGQNSVIQGWEEGVKGMKEGEIRELQIPSAMGYGEYGTGSIPGNAGLIFMVELLEVK